MIFRFNIISYETPQAPHRLFSFFDRFADDAARSRGCHSAAKRAWQGACRPGRSAARFCRSRVAARGTVRLEGADGDLARHVRRSFRLVGVDRDRLRVLCPPPWHRAGDAERRRGDQGGISAHALLGRIFRDHHALLSVWRSFGMPVFPVVSAPVAFRFQARREPLIPECRNGYVHGVQRAVVGFLSLAFVCLRRALRRRPASRNLFYRVRFTVMVGAAVRQTPENQQSGVRHPLRDPDGAHLLELRRNPRQVECFHRNLDRAVKIRSGNSADDAGAADFDVLGSVRREREAKERREPGVMRSDIFHEKVGATGEARRQDCGEDGELSGRVFSD